MLKNLAARAVVPVALAVTGFVVVCCILLYTSVKNDMISDAIQREVSLADIIVKSARYAMLKDDRESLRQTIKTLGEQQGIEHVRIFNKKGLVMFSAEPAEINRLVDKEAAGCVACHRGPEPSTQLGPMEQARRFENAHGHSVLAITAPIYNDPSCIQSACHFHSPETKILGTLDIGLLQTPLEKSLAALQLKMLVFCLMVLILAVGGVSALLRRQVLMPVRQLIVYADSVSQGNLETPPPRGAEEIKMLAGTLREMASRLKAKGGNGRGSGEV